MGEASDKQRSRRPGGPGARGAPRGRDRLVRELLEGLHLVAVTLDAEGRVTFCNDFLLRLTGWGREEVTGRDWFDTFLPEERRGEVRRAFFKPALRENVPAHYENEIATRAGGRRLIAWNNTLLRDAGGRVVGTTSIGEDVTERRRAEEALRESEDRFRTMADSAPVLIWVNGLRGCEFVNRGYLEFLGRGMDEVLSMDWATAVHPEDAEEYVGLYLRAFEARERFEAQFRFRRADGEYRWLKSVGLPRFTPDHTFLGYVGCSVDVTDLKRSEQVMRDSQSRVVGIIESAMDAIITVDAEQRVVLFNHAAEQMFRCPADDALGQPLDRFIPERLHESHRQHIRAFGETGVTTRAMGGSRAVSGLRSDGEEFPVEASISQIEAGGQRLYTVIMRDITERVRAEEEIKRQSEIIALAPVMVCGLDDHITFWSTGSEQLYGWTRGEALGEVSHELLGTQFPQPLADIRARLHREGRWEGELLQTRRDGSQITVLGLWVLHRDVGERPAAVLKINTDITEKKKVESQLLRAQRLESIGTLASGIAHDLNNVLSPVMMALEVLQLRYTDEESRFWLKMLEESVERGAGMVKQVLSFARGTEGRRAPVNLKHLIAEVANIVKETFPKSISLRYDATAGLWGVYADPTQFHQVLLNLVVNARDAMPQGGTLSVEAENRVLDESYAGTGAEARPGRYVAVTVSDTGVGMPPEVVERVFDPFFTTKEQGKGTGLGLSTALQIVKGHGGFMNVYSEPGRGTTFTVYVPAAESGEDAREGQERAALPGGHGELILVVDDEESIRQITTKTLEAFGYRVLTAGDGTEAVAVYAQHKDEIAAVICDMMMPFMDGRATTLALHRMNPRVPIISSSGLAEAPHVEEAAGRGVRAYLPKPYTAETLLRTLADVLGGGI